MERYFLLARSVTHAQQMVKELERAGIFTRVRRADATLTGRGCGYMVEIAGRHYALAMKQFEESSGRPIKVYRQYGTGLVEVKI